MIDFGGRRSDFTVDAHRAFVILPSAPRTGRPWIWYAPTFVPGPDGQGLSLPAVRHEWLMGRLVAAGVAIGGVDVGESYGNPEGRTAYTAFHRHAVSAFSFAAKACLLPQS